ncbi:MAG: alpha/beta fold hydrolase [Panacagrimonas sp.]
MAKPEKPQPAEATPNLGAQARESVERALLRNTVDLKLPDYDAEPVAVSPKEVVYARGTLRLWHYLPMTDEVYRVPLIMVMPLFGRPDILDLVKGQSLVEYLLLCGYDVFLMDWGRPRREHAHVGFEHYVDQFIPDCIRVACEITGEKEVSLFGYCSGGMLALIHAARHPDKQVRNLAVAAVPIDSDGMPISRAWTDPKYFDLERLIESMGVIPASLIDASFQVAKPLAKTTNRIAMLKKADDHAYVKAYLQMERWSADQISLPGQVARQLINDIFQKNLLFKGQMVLGGERVDLGRIKIPFLHATAQHDYLVPKAASKDVINVVGSADKTAIEVKGGHVSLLAGAGALYRLWPQLDAWLSVRSV